MAHNPIAGSYTDPDTCCEDLKAAYKAGWLAHHAEWCVEWDDLIGPVSGVHEPTDTQSGQPAE